MRLAAFLLLATSSLRASVVISELMYNPRQGEENEYVELHNAGGTALDLGGWKLGGGIEFTFPAGAEISARGYAVVARSRDDLLAAYPLLDGSIVYGNYTGALSNGGEELTLFDALGRPTPESLVYDDELPWEFLADGFGASLERSCATEPAGLPENWRASAVPLSPEEFGGTPGGPGAVSVCPPEALERPRVLFSEIMYHPVLEDSLEDEHEFLEIHNAEAKPVSLGGWRLAGGVDYTFPAQAVIGSGEYLVVAANRKRLAAVEAYGLTEHQLYGDYRRRLDNGGESVVLVGAAGQGVDVASYDDDSPWAEGADALGAGTSWLAPELLPLEDHRYMGHSLERVSFDVSSREVANWSPSPLDGATPGRANASSRPAPLPVVADIDVDPVGSAGMLIREDDQVFVQARFSPAGPAGAVDLEYFTDAVGQSGEPLLSVAMHDDGVSGGDALAGDGVYSVTLPGLPENSIVRYRILADRGEGTEVVSPRTTDPHDWHACFVSPVINTSTRVYQLFISPASWTRLWDNLGAGRVSGCAESSTWNAKVPAVFVHDGRVYDVHVRYQGSRWNRRNGRDIRSWPYPGPTRPSPLKALSWRLSFPRYNQLEGKSVTILNKLQQACPGGYTSGMGYRLFAEADIPASETRYVRFHINGGYYHYMMEYERPGEDMMRRYHGEQAEKYPELPRERVGHLFKSAGCTCDEGPYGWGDERLLFSYCGHSAVTRYATTYDRKTHEWDSHDEFIRLIEDLHAAKSAGRQALRDYFATRFDLDLLLSHIAIINYQVPFDDVLHNHFLYQRLSDGKWLLVPWDLDRNYGGWKGASASLYMGEEGDPDNRGGWWNRLKDALLKSYREEYEDRLLLLNNTLLHPDHVNEVLDEVQGEANPAEASSAPGGACSFSSTGIRSYVASRHQIINDELAAVRVDAGSDQTVFAGMVVQFDARASRPAPGLGVTYSWDNGMEGDTPTFVYAEPGTYTVTLTITADGTPFQDTVTITVLPLPVDVFVEHGGEVVMEAESFWTNHTHAAVSSWWEVDDERPGYSGTGYMEAKDTQYEKFNTSYASTSPELRYAILFEQTGSYRVWLRGLSASSTYDSCHVNLNGIEREVGFITRFTVDPDDFLWSNNTHDQGPQTVTVPEPGIHYLSIWIRESGQIIDKVILTKNTFFSPAGLGPQESDREPTGAMPPFVRGDANADAQVDISDALAILFFLFNGGSALSCEDHGDVDDNGLLQVTDAIALLGFLFQNGPPPEAPFPSRGYDRTEDDYGC